MASTPPRISRSSSRVHGDRLGSALGFLAAPEAADAAAADADSAAASDVAAGFSSFGLATPASPSHSSTAIGFAPSSAGSSSAVGGGVAAKREARGPAPGAEPPPCSAGLARRVTAIASNADGDDEAARDSGASRDGGGAIVVGGLDAPAALEPALEAATSSSSAPDDAMAPAVSAGGAPMGLDTACWLFWLM